MTAPGDPTTPAATSGGPMAEAAPLAEAGSVAAAIAEVRAELTGPGGAFEVVTEQVAGIGGADPIDLRVYANRLANLREVFAFAEAHGDATFIVYGDRRISFAEFGADANRVAAGLVAAGVTHGDRVAVLSQNNPEWCLSFWATVNLGGILVGLNGWWNTDEILFGLADSGARVLIADARRLGRVIDRLDELEHLEHVFLIDPEGPDGAALPAGPATHATAPFADLLAGDDPGPPDTPLSEGDAAVIFYTSGTTGRPKGAISTHRGMVANLQNTVFSLTANGMVLSRIGEHVDGTGGQPAALFTSPLFHVSGCHSTLVVGLLGGLKLVMVPGRFTPEMALGLIQDEHVSIWSTVPTMIWRTCEFPGRADYDTSSITSVAFGGSPAAAELQRMIRDTFPNVRATSNAYGLTESSSVATLHLAGSKVDRPDSVGLPMPVVELAIAAPGGEHLDTNQQGEVLIRGPIVMPGYWNRPDATAETIRDGWLHTGDLGHLDDDGYLFITDRAKDMIIRGGENVYCVEIEQRLVEHPDVADAAVVGMPHAELGEEVKAVVELVDGAQTSDAELQAWVAAALAAFKVPSQIERWPDKLPRNASGKLLKNVLRGSGPATFAETM
ncbi:MAG: class I adenylate-forming enzyme family protein [Microthrixaceae bacterium]